MPRPDAAGWRRFLRRETFVVLLVAAVAVVTVIGVADPSLVGLAKPPGAGPGLNCASDDFIVYSHNTLGDPPASGMPQTPEEALAAEFDPNPEGPSARELHSQADPAGGEHYERSANGKKVQVVMVKPHGNGWVVTDWAACNSSLGKKQ